MAVVFPLFTVLPADVDVCEKFLKFTVERQFHAAQPLLHNGNSLAHKEMEGKMSERKMKIAERTTRCDWCSCLKLWYISVCIYDDIVWEWDPILRYPCVSGGNVESETMIMVVLYYFARNLIREHKGASTSFSFSTSVFALRCFVLRGKVYRTLRSRNYRQKWGFVLVFAMFCTLNTVVHASHEHRVRLFPSVGENKRKFMWEVNNM